MRTTVLGSSASYAGPGQACAGHLVEGGGVCVVFDLGNGALANLGRVVDPITVDAVFISHAHPDHFLDLYALQALLRYAPSGPAPPLRLYASVELLERAACLLSSHGRVEFAEAFAMAALADRIPVRVGDMLVTPYAVEHEGATFALVAEADGRRMCYTSDTRPGNAASSAARGADLVLAEATLPETHAGRAPHMTASQAGALAEDAGASKLVLTHMWPTTPRHAILESAKQAFGGQVHVAEELLTVEV
jgi:ribonuclease BN (tRNA processing enzyme)